MHVVNKNVCWKYINMKKRVNTDQHNIYLHQETIRPIHTELLLNYYVFKTFGCVGRKGISASYIMEPRPEINDVLLDILSHGYI